MAATTTTKLLLLYMLLSKQHMPSNKVFTWREWWKPAVIYQIYPRSFMDSDGNGIGDLRGITSRLEYFRELSVNTIWLSPVFKSPMADFGYDISDFVDIDPLFGTLEDFDDMISRLHELGLRLIMDFVPNHTSDQHKWFVESRKSNSTSNYYQNYYVWKDPKPGCTDPITDAPENCLPNNWVSFFGGSIWQWVPERQQYYLHQFLTVQPDLNFREPKVQEEMKDVLRFWFERGVDGMRIDAIRHLYEAGSFADEPINPNFTPPPGEQLEKVHFDSVLHTLTVEQPEIHEVLREWRSEIFDYYSADMNYRFMTTETSAYDHPSTLAVYYGTEQQPEADFPQNTQLNQLFTHTVNGTEVYRLVDRWMGSIPPGKWPNWVMAHHDERRLSNKLGYQYRRSGKIFHLLLPGTAITYYGEEIGMEDIWVSYNETQDPFAKNNPYFWEEYTRDPGRSPMQWDSSVNAGFSVADKTWLPVHDNYKQGVNVEDERSDPSSVLNLFKKLINLRKNAPAFQTNYLTYVVITEQIFSFLRMPEVDDGAASSYLVTINFSNMTSTDDYARGLLDQQLAFVGDVGVIVLSSDMDRNGLLVDMLKVELKPGEALVIETMIRPSFDKKHVKL